MDIGDIPTLTVNELVKRMNRSDDCLKCVNAMIRLIVVLPSGEVEVMINMRFILCL